MARSKDIEPQSVAPHPDDELTRLSTDQIVEQGPGLGAADEAMPPSGDPGDLSGFGGGFGLPDLGVGDDSPVDDLTDPGGLGSRLLDDLDGSSDVPDPTDGIDGLGDGGWGIPDIDDQTGWAMDSGDDILEGTPSSEFWEGAGRMAEYADDEYAAGSSVVGDFLMEAAAAATSAGNEAGVDEAKAAANAIEIEPTPIPAEQGGGDPDDDDEGPKEQGEDAGGEGEAGPPETQSTPIPEEANDGGGRGGLDPTVTGGGDPAPEIEPAGGRGDLIGGRGDVDPDPDLDDVGEATEIDTVAAGLGAVDPVGSTLIDGDAGDLAAVAADPDTGGDLGLDLDDALADLDLAEEA